MRERKGERRREIYSYVMHGENQTHRWTVSNAALHDEINKIRWCLKLGRGETDVMKFVENRISNNID